MTLDYIRLTSFPFYLPGEAKARLQKEPTNSTWDVLAHKFLVKLFLSKKTYIIEK